MHPLMPRSALILLVPEADQVVGRLRLDHDPVARAGLGAHVTLLFPFAPAARLNRDVMAQLEKQFSSTPGVAGAIELRFDRIARFPNVSYLALADAAPVVEKIRALAALWPAYPPYEGRFADVVPHLTVAHGDESVLASVDSELAAALPLIANVRSASLVVEDDGGQWHPKRTFSLDGSKA